MIVGGAAIFGGRGRVVGSCLGAIFVGLIDKVLREGVPITRTIDLGDEKVQVAGVAQLPPGAVPAVLGVVLMLAVLIEPWIVRRRVLARLWAWLRGLPPPPFPTSAASRSPARRRAGRRCRRAASARAASPPSSTAATRRRSCWCRALAVRPLGAPRFLGRSRQFFSILLAFSEIALLTVGLTFVMANGDIDLSVGSVLALSGAVAAVIMKDTRWGPLAAALSRSPRASSPA